MKSRELMPSNEKPNEFVGFTIKSDCKSIDSKDSARQSVGSESNGAILRNQATDIKQHYTSQILTVSEKRSESYIKINSDREHAKRFQQQASGMHIPNESSSSLIDPLFNERMDAAEVPRKTDQFKRIDDGVKRAAEQDFGFDEERFVLKMQVQDSTESNPSAQIPGRPSDLQNQNQPPLTMMLKQKILEYENQIQYLKNMVEELGRERKSLKETVNIAK